MDHSDCDDPRCQYHGSEAFRQSVEESIASHGWFTTYVLPDDTSFGYGYSIGFTELDHPEMIVTGFNPRQTHSLLGDAYRAVKAGHVFRDGERTDEVCAAPYTTGIVKVPDAMAEHFAFRAFDYYGQKIEVLQAVWPDPDNLLPWDEGHHPMLDRQPVLSLLPRLAF